MDNFKTIYIILAILPKAMDGNLIREIFPQRH